MISIKCPPTKLSTQTVYRTSEKEVDCLVFCLLRIIHRNSRDYNTCDGRCENTLKYVFGSTLH